MNPSSVSGKVVTERLLLIEELLHDIRLLPLSDSTLFLLDKRNVWTAESCLRRCLESLLDIGRHILAKAFARGVAEYKDIPRQLKERGVFDQAEFQLLFQMAGYRNRMVHFYHEVTPDELYRICTTELDDIERVADAYRRWLRANPQLVSDEL